MRPTIGRSPLCGLLAEALHGDAMAVLVTAVTAQAHADEREAVNFAALYAFDAFHGGSLLTPTVAYQFAELFQKRATEARTLLAHPACGACQ